MPNIQVTHDSDLNNARSESSPVINPNNPMQIVSASKKFKNIQTYDFTLATQYSAVRFAARPMAFGGSWR